MEARQLRYGRVPVGSTNGRRRVRLKPDDVSLVGTDVPIRVVQLQYLDGEWQVTASETAGPGYHRPGFTELISGEFSYTTSELDECVFCDEFEVSDEPRDRDA